MHLIKLCVGCDTVVELLEWREQTRIAGEPWILRTRQTPKRVDELLDQGSLFRVFKGVIRSRQRILAIDTLGEGSARRCHITLDERVVLTDPTPRRPFQGWRYLTPADAPGDLSDGSAAEAVPDELASRLKAIGAW